MIRGGVNVRPGLATVIGALLASVGAGCSSAGNGSASDGGPDGAGACNAVVNTAATFEQTRVAGTLPTADAAGGAFMPGTYHRTSSTLYTGAGGLTGPNGVTYKQTMVISDGDAGAFIGQNVESDSGAAEWHGTLMGTPAASTVSFVVTCPLLNAPLGNFSYTATATSFTLYDTTANTVDIYVKQ